MDFLKKLFPTLTQIIGIGSKQKQYDPSQWSSMSAFGGASGADLENNKEWVFIALDKLASSVSSVRYKVMRVNNSGKGDTEVFTGPIADFLSKASESFTGKDFTYLHIAYKELLGNSFWRKEKDKTLTPLIPTNMSPVFNREKTMIVGYKYQLPLGGFTEYSADEILHDRRLDPRSPFWGVGRLVKIFRWVDTNSYAQEFNRLFFTQGASFGGFITTQEESEERIKLIKAGLNRNHVGIENTHKIGVLPKGSDFKAAETNMKDMQFIELDDRYRDKILSGMGIPKTLAGFTTDVNRASAEASEYIYAKYTMKPIVDSYVEFLNNFIVPFLDKTNKYYISYESFIPEDRTADDNEIKTALGGQPYASINEIRERKGLPPVAGGDTVYGNPFMAPVGTTPAERTMRSEKESLMHRPIRVSKEIEIDNKIDDAFDGIINKIEKIFVGKRKDVQTDQTIDAQSREAKDAIKHKQFTGRVSEHQKLLANKIKDFNNRQKNEVVRNLGQIIKGIRAVKKGDIFDYDSEVSIMIDMVSPLLKGLITDQALAEWADMDFPGTFNSTEANLAKVINESAKRMSKSYNDTTLVLLKQALNEGIKEGENVTELADRIGSVYEFSDITRATMVAHTESFYAANKGSLEAYKQSGVVQTIRWYTSEDERVCQFCAPLNGKIVDVDKNYYNKGDVITGVQGGTLSLDYRGIDVPPLHPNCNCFVVAEKIEVQPL